MPPFDLVNGGIMSIPALRMRMPDKLSAVGLDEWSIENPLSSANAMSGLLTIVMPCLHQVRSTVC